MNWFVLMLKGTSQINSKLNQFFLALLVLLEHDFDLVGLVFDVPLDFETSFDLDLVVRIVKSLSSSFLFDLVVRVLGLAKTSGPIFMVLLFSVEIEVKSKS